MDRKLTELILKKLLDKAVAQLMTGVDVSKEQHDVDIEWVLLLRLGNARVLTANYREEIDIFYALKHSMETLVSDPNNGVIKVLEAESEQFISSLKGVKPH